tara:strand:+ start:141 stop:956 length:816 start_codon:yes stop_codon:yes gene_type:complete
MNHNNKFGVFYTCYTEKTAVEYSLKIFRKIYPEVPVLLVSDGGSDYSDLEQKFKHLKTSLGEDSRGHIPDLTQDSFRKEENQNEIKKSIYIFLERIKKAIAFCGNPEWMLVMEPDVLVRGKLNFPEGEHLLGSRVNEGLSTELRTALSNIPGAIDVNTWGVTPAVFRTSSFLKVCDWIENNEEDFSKLCMADYRLAYYDVMFAVMFGVVGYHEAVNPDIIECFRDPSWQTSHHPLVHQFRAMYPKSFEGYVGTHIKHKDGIGDYWPWEKDD